jgi:membrane-associated phospholipid phosphatase
MPSALLFCSMEGSARASSLAASLHVKLGLSTPMVSAFLYSIAVFALLAHAYTTGDATVEVDIWLANVLHANATPSATAVLAAVTTLGSTPVLLLVAGTAAGYLAGRRRGGEAALLVVTLVGVQLLGWMLKAIFERPRPSFDDPVASAGWFSFPSGHAMSSIALYGALAYAFADRLYSARTRMAAVGGLVLLVAAIGFSRLYLGVHYLTDVLAGYSAGLAWLLLAIGLTFSRGGRRGSHGRIRTRCFAAARRRSWSTDRPRL